MSAVRCCIVRHGETPWNVERRLQGHIDIPLNALGLAQAAATGRYLQQRQLATPFTSFSAVLCSDLQRTRQTAAPIAAALQVPTTATPVLRERHYGVFEGKTPTEIAATAQTDYRVLLDRQDLYAAPGNAEPLAAMVARLENFMRQLAADYAGQAVVLVTHGGVLDVLHRLATGSPQTGPRTVAIPNAGLNWLNVADTADGLVWTLQNWGETAHLSESSLDEIL